MFLAFDIGNTQTSLGIYKGNELLFHGRYETKHSRTSDEWASLILPLLSHQGFSKEVFRGGILCSVVPPAEGAIEQFAKQYLGITCRKISPDQNLGFSIRVEPRSEIGADRLVNVAYAVRKLELPAVIVDFGTATTFDIVSQDKTYEGGLIVPGVRLGLEALSGRTAKLPSVALNWPRKIIGTNTTECIQSGVLHGYCALIDGLFKKLETEVGGIKTVAMTGGLSVLFQDRLSFPCLWLSDLTLDGLALIFQEL